MIKKTPKVFYEYNGKMMSVCDIYKSNKNVVAVQNIFFQLTLMLLKTITLFQLK